MCVIFCVRLRIVCVCVDMWVFAITCVCVNVLLCVFVSVSVCSGIHFCLYVFLGVWCVYVCVGKCVYVCVVIYISNVDIYFKRFFISIDNIHVLSILGIYIPLCPWY